MKALGTKDFMAMGQAKAAMAAADLSYENSGLRQQVATLTEQLEVAVEALNFIQDKAMQMPAHLLGVCEVQNKSTEALAAVQRGDG